MASFSMLFHQIKLKRVKYPKTFKIFVDILYSFHRPTNKAAVQKSNGKGMEVGIADDQAKDFDFEKTEMKYDSTGMFHWTPARSIEDCILDRNQAGINMIRLGIITDLCNPR